MKLSSLYINAFRGATKPITINFSQDKNITLIYAENGNGKSSISDALVCVCTDSLGSLDDKSSKDASFLKSSGANNSDLSIKLQTDSQLFNLSLSDSSNKIIKTPSLGFPQLSALRRAQITSFIDDKPSERYKLLASFIDVSNIQKAESELKKLITSLDRDYNANIKSLSDAENTLIDIWDKEGQPLGNKEIWVQAELIKDNLKLGIEYKQNATILQNWINLQSLVADITTEKFKLDTATSAFVLAENNLKDYFEKKSNADSKLLTLLNETKTFLTSQDSIDTCPVCHKENEKSHLLKNINERIANLKELEKLTLQFNKCNSEISKLKTGLSSKKEPFISKLTAFKTTSSVATNLSFNSLLINILDTNTTNKNYEEFLLVADKLIAEISKLSFHNESINKSFIQFNAIKSNNDSIIGLTKKCKDLEKLLANAKATLLILEKSRKDFIDNELDSISNEVEAMYQAIHPNEGLGNVKLFLNHSFQSSLNLTANFHTETAIASQSVYSESHLDTLGICIFIALAKKGSNNDKILILDDVVMSVDEKHLDRIIELIHAQSAYFAHIFITTHYRPWRERYRNNRAPNSQVQFIELRSWTKERGITLAKPVMVLDEIKYHLDNPEHFHRENLAGVTGRFLEALLDFLSFNFQSRLKRKPGNDYTLSELLDCLSKDLLKVLKVQKMELLADGKYDQVKFTEEVTLKSHIESIKELKAIRNQVGAHFTYVGALVSDSDIEDFAKATVKLADLLVCPKDGNLPDRNKSGSYWETKSGSLRLFPLLEP